MANKYCESIEEVIKAHTKGSPFFNRAFLESLRDLDLRLEVAIGTQSQQQSSGKSGWFSRVAKFDGFMDILDKGLNKFMAGAIGVEDEVKNKRAIAPFSSMTTPLMPSVASKVGVTDIPYTGNHSVAAVRPKPVPSSVAYGDTLSAYDSSTYNGGAYSNPYGGYGTTERPVTNGVAAYSSYGDTANDTVYNNAYTESGYGTTSAPFADSAAVLSNSYSGYGDTVDDAINKVAYHGDSAAYQKDTANQSDAAYNGNAYQGDSTAYNSAYLADSTYQGYGSYSSDYNASQTTYENQPEYHAQEQYDNQTQGHYVGQTGYGAPSFNLSAGQIFTPAPLPETAPRPVTTQNAYASLDTAPILTTGASDDEDLDAPYTTVADEMRLFDPAIKEVEVVPVFNLKDSDSSWGKPSTISEPPEVGDSSFQTSYEYSSPERMPSEGTTPRNISPMERSRLVTPELGDDSGSSYKSSQQLKTPTAGSPVRGLPDPANEFHEKYEDLGFGNSGLKTSSSKTANQSRSDQASDNDTGSFNIQFLGFNMTLTTLSNQRNRKQDRD